MFTILVFSYSVHCWILTGPRGRFYIKTPLNKLILNAFLEVFLAIPAEAYVNPTAPYCCQLMVLLVTTDAALLAKYRVF